MPAKTAKPKTQNTPKLRFAGFSGGWEEKKLGEVGKTVTGKTPSTLNREYYDGKYLFVSPADFTGQRMITETKTTCTKAGFEQVRKVKAGAVLFVCIGSTIGKIAQAGEDCITNQQINSIVSSDKNSNDFIYYNLLKKAPKIKLLAGRQAVPIINKSQFEKITIKLPPLPEQKKIADFLGATDAWIENLRAQKENLESYKKGMMQKIFSKQIRFKDETGKDFPAWKEKKLGEVFVFLSSNSFSRSQLTSELGNIKNIHYGDIHTKFKTNFDIKIEDVPYISSKIDVSKIKDESFCKEGDIVVADASEDYKDIGKSIELINLGNQKVIAGLHTFLLRKNGQVDIVKGFSGYLMKTEFVRNQIMEMATGISVLGISKGNLSKVLFNLPFVLEQQKIADFLTSVDKVIESKQQQITQAETWKKGLMQELFV